MTPAARHRRAILFMVIAAVCWSSASSRALSITNARRSCSAPLFMAVFVAGVLTVMHGRRMPQAVVAVGMPGLVSGLFLAGTFFFFIGSLTRTTVANTFVLMSVSPFLAALAGRMVLKETVPMRTWVAISVAFVGIVVMFADSLDAGRLVGNLLALGVSCCFAAQVTMLRKFRARVDMLPQVMIGACPLGRIPRLATVRREGATRFCDGKRSWRAPATAASKHRPRPNSAPGPFEPIRPAMGLAMAEAPPPRSLGRRWRRRERDICRRRARSAVPRQLPPR
jgi:hypothetical protein